MKNMELHEQVDLLTKKEAHLKNQCGTKLKIQISKDSLLMGKISQNEIIRK